VRSRTRLACPGCGYATLMPPEGEGAVCRRCREVVAGVPADEPYNGAAPVSGVCALRCPGCDGPVRPWQNRACPVCGGTLRPDEGEGTA